MTSAASGKVSARTHLFLPDGNAPPEPQEIMVGTQLSIIVDSNVAEYWSGALAIADANRDYGLLSGRDFNEITNEWEGSHFPAAGVEARVWDWEEDPGIDGFTLYTGSTGIEANDWFIIDYTATSAGDCNVGFYDHSEDWFNPIDYLEFSHVRTRDFNNDTKVDFTDFALLASYWQAADCDDPNWCEGVDLNTEGTVDVNDLMLFCSYWLEETDKRWWPE